MTEQPLRAGIIGLGIGGAHAKGYLNGGAAELVALCDSNEVRLREAADQYRVPAAGCFTDYRRMLAEGRLDLVSICLPNSLHAESAIAALESGAHVLCEKPLAPTVAEAEAMVETARRRDRRLMVAYNYRYRTDTRWMWRAVRSGRLGTIYQVDASWRRETGIPGAGWFGSKPLAGGGPLIDLGVHILDLTLWMLGFPAARTVSGTTRTVFGQRGLKTWGGRWAAADKGPQAARPDFDVEDGGIGFIRFENGPSLLLHATWAEHRQPKDDVIRVELQGTEGTAVLTMPNYTRDDTLRLYTEIEGEPVTIAPRVRWEGLQSHEALIADILNSLHDGAPVPTDAKQGLAAVRILEALYTSARTGHEVTLDPVPSMAAD